MSAQTCPWIGINADFIPAGKRTKAHLQLPAGYFDGIASAGGLPIILPPLGKERDLEAVLDRLDGVVLCGGLDLDPKRLGFSPHPSVRPMAERRQENDRLLIRQILSRKLPVLAIGVGMHLLNVSCSGTLFLHLPEDQPRGLPHMENSEGPHRHSVQLQADTRIEEIYGVGEILVNSCHHQAVRKIGAGLRVAALAPDGVIEAIEATDPDWFCVGVQWHPESETASALDMQLFEGFVQACLKQSQPLQVAA